MKDRLKILLSASLKLARKSGLKNKLVTLTGLTKELLNADICSIFLHNPIRNELWTTATHYADQKVRIPDSEGIVGHVYATGETVNIVDAYNDPRFDPRADKKTGYRTKSILAVPLFNLKGKKLGAVEVINKLDNTGFDQEDIDLINYVAFYISSITDVASLCEKLKKAREEIIYKLSNVTRYKDKETRNHILRVGLYSAIIAKAIGFENEEVNAIKLAASMHDIGKVGIPDKILLKPGKLDREEWEIMKKHTTIGYNILKGGKGRLSGIAAMIALDHHEKWDGTGYPGGKKGNEISLPGRITALSDFFDALTSDRPYKKAWSYKAVIRELKIQSGKYFDPGLTKVFLENIDEIIQIREKYRDCSPYIVV